ncbi:MAG TPA: ABC transporter permease [Candidatus Paceibacterota bacterium]|nr:ABC transporter permease [Candidatus Paceibacterota bacterium]
MDAKGILISWYTVVRKDVVRMLRIWPQTFLPAAVTSALNFVIFGAFIGSRVGEIEGVPYIMFIVPGIVMLSVVMNAYSNAAFAMFSSKFFNRNIDELLVSPTPPWVIVAGFVTGGVIRGVLTGIIVLLVALFFTHILIHNLFVILAFLILTSILFSLAGLANGVYAKSIDGINIVPTFILTPLVYLGGIFYSTQALPGVWAAVTKADPIFYVINGFRWGFLGTADIPLWESFLVLGALAAVFFGLTWYLLSTGLGLKQ